MEKLNMNPKGLKAGDCVIRSIAFATNQSWDKVYKDLCEVGFKLKRLPNEKQVYQKYLENIGWIKYKQPKNFDKKLTIKEFLREATFIEENARITEVEKILGEKLIISCANHLTSARKNENGDFVLVDTWDCSFKCVGNYWAKGVNKNEI